MRGSICTYLVGDGGIDRDGGRGRGEEGEKERDERMVKGWSDVAVGCCLFVAVSGVLIL